MTALVEDSAAIRSTQSGQVIGGRGSFGGFAWLGIPYAAPPIAEWRWRAPREPAPWSGVRQALEPPSPCMQPAPFRSDSAPNLRGCEDCLSLNIWAPSPGQRLEGHQPLPVMVWVHGGGNVEGDGHTYDASKLAVTQDVIVVTVNYRLGVFGWFRHPALREGTSPEEGSGNFAILDIVQSLRWVKRNIENFGGDPACVTIFGESAGGQNVYALLTSPIAAGLFHKAIVQSGGDLTMAPETAENYADDSVPGAIKSSAEVLLRLVINDGLALNRHDAKAYVGTLTHNQIREYLYKKSLEEFDRAYRQIAADNDNISLAAGFPQLFRDGRVLSRHTICEAIGLGQSNTVPVILGTTREENTILLPYAGNTTVVSTAPDRGGLEIPDKKRYQLTAEYLAKIWKADGVDQPASLLHHKAPGSVYTYRFDWNELEPASWLDGLSPGATHGLDIAFIFGNRDAGPPMLMSLIKESRLASFTELSDAMMSYWSNFARTGQPGRGRIGDLPEWHHWGSGEARLRSSMILDSTMKGGLRMSSEIATRDGTLAELRIDPRLGSFANRCEFVFSLTQMKVGWYLTSQEYGRFLMPNSRP